MSRWFRHYAGMMSDPKFGGVARFCKRSRAEVLFVWGCLLESASEYDSAAYSWDADAMAELLGIDTPEAQAIHDGLVTKGLLADGRIASWDKRQFKSDDSGERVKAFRQRQRGATKEPDNGDATACNGDVTAPDTEAEPEKELEAPLPAATVVATARAPRKPKTPKAAAEPPWKTDVEFNAAWDACPDKMRKRSESRENTYAHWLKGARDCGSPAALRQAHAAYIRKDPDVARTGGPGFHVWLKEGRYEHWLVQAAVTAGAAWTGPQGVRNAVIRETSTDFASSYLDPCIWQDGALIPRTGYAADKLKRLRSLTDVEIREPQGAAA